MIRKAKMTDIPSIIALQREVESEEAIWGYGVDSPDEWSKRDLTWTLLALTDDSPIGFVYCSPKPYTGECVFDNGSRILEIVELVITTKKRCHGYGHELISAMQEQARADGFTHLRLYSAAKRFDSIVKFYRSCGFTPWYVEMTKEISAEQPHAADGEERRR